MNLQELQAQLNQRMEECGGDILEYNKRYNRHTLKLTLLNEQSGEEEWGEHSITFYNEDNAINHLSVVGEFMELLTKEENRTWGFYHTEQKVVDNILNPIKKILEGKN
jgi:hypothetical protein